MSIVLVTGASGFIGAALAPALARAGHVVRATYRTPPAHVPADLDAVVVGPSATDAAWRDVLRGVSAVVHLAGPAHSKYPDAYLHREIAAQTARLAERASQAGVARFLFVSSIKAAAASSVAPLKPSDPPTPADAYGHAKLEAENAVLAHTDLRPVVLRPPLVCAADAKANFAAMLRIAGTSWPLPFVGMKARRSVLGRESFIRAVANILAKHDGVSGVFHIADQPALTVAEMIAALREGMGRPRNQFSAPGIAAVLPRALRDSLVIDDSDFRAAYGNYVDSDARAMLKRIGAAWTSR